MYKPSIGVYTDTGQLRGATTQKCLQEKPTYMVRCIKLMPQAWVLFHTNLFSPNWFVAVGPPAQSVYHPCGLYRVFARSGARSRVEDDQRVQGQPPERITVFFLDRWRCIKSIRALCADGDNGSTAVLGAAPVSRGLPLWPPGDPNKCFRTDLWAPRSPSMSSSATA